MVSLIEAHAQSAHATVQYAALAARAAVHRGRMFIDPANRTELRAAHDARRDELVATGRRLVLSLESVEVEVVKFAAWSLVHMCWTDATRM